MPRLALNRKDTAATVAFEPPLTADFTSQLTGPASKRFHCGGIVAMTVTLGRTAASRNRGQITSPHNWARRRLPAEPR